MQTLFTTPDLNFLKFPDTSSKKGSGPINTKLAAKESDLPGTGSLLSETDVSGKISTEELLVLIRER